MKELLKTCLVYVCCVIAGMAMLSLFMHLDLFSGTYIYYYRTLYDAALACIIVMMILIALHFVFRKKEKPLVDFSPTLIVSSTGICGLVLALFVTIAPMTIDRSYTIFSLADMSDNNRVYTAEEIEGRFKSIYIEEYGSTRKRIEEQISIGNIEEVDGGYRISSKGENLIKLFRFVEAIYPVDDPRVVYPGKYENGEE